MSSKHIIIVGGGVIGSSIAYHLCRSRYDVQVTVIERDPSYRRASSFLAMGGVRQQFSSSQNIALAQHSIRFYQTLNELSCDRDLKQPVHFLQRGYLFLANEATSQKFEERYDTQLRLGARVERLDVDAIHTLVPDLVLDDIRFALFGPEDGYINPRAVLTTLRRLAEHAGALFITSNVTALTVSGGTVTGVILEGDEKLETSSLVCAAGPYAANLAALADIDLPVTPVRQQLFRCTLPRHWPHRFPMIVDPSGVHWRHDDQDQPDVVDQIVVARTNLTEPPGENFDCDMKRWETDFRPPLIARLPELKPATLAEGWAGLYEMTPDHNPLLGEHPDLRGLFLANGFSGHGLMMAPAVGSAMAELLTTGTSAKLDIIPFDPGRFSRNQLFWDDAMV